MAERRRPRGPRRPRLPAPLERAVRPVQDTQADLQRWVQRMTQARQLRQDWAAQYKVDILAQTFTGALAEQPGLGDTDMAVIINRFWPTVKAQMAGLLAQEPTFFVRPQGKRASEISAARAASSEATLQQIARQDAHLVQEAELALQQSFWAIGVLKCVYDPRLERNPQRGKPLYILGEDGQPMLDPQTGQPLPLMDPRTGTPMTQPEKILNDEVYRWQWVNWNNMLLPDEGPAMLRWTWIGEEIEVLVEDAKDDDRFPSRLRGQLVATRKPRSEGAHDVLRSAFGTPEEDETLWYTECWDMRTKRHLIYAEGQPFSATHFLLDGDLPDGVEDHPYALVPGYTAITDPEPSPWPVPHVWNWLSMQREYNIRREQMMNAAKRSARKIYYDANTFPNSDDAVASLQSNVDMEAVQVTDTNRPPVTITDPGSTPDITRDLLALEKDWLNATGMPGERMGNPSSDTATQAVISDRAATLRQGKMKNAVNLMFATAGRKMLQLIQGTITLEIFVKIRDWTDKEVQEYLRTRFGAMTAMALGQSPGILQLLVQRYGREQWTPVTREQLQFEAEVGVVPGSIGGGTPEQRRQELSLYVQALAQIGAVLPTALSSPLFMREMANVFEVGDELMVDELIAAIQQGIQHGVIGQHPPGPENGAAPSPATPGQVLQQPFVGSRLQSLLTRSGV
jgi:hypothetical protein